MYKEAEQIVLSNIQTKILNKFRDKLIIASHLKDSDDSTAYPLALLTINSSAEFMQELGLISYNDWYNIVFKQDVDYSPNNTKYHEPNNPSLI